MAHVALKDVYKSFGSTEVIHGITLDINHGELTVLLGPSGCGKSTLLRMIAGLEEVTKGDIEIDEKRVNEVGPADRGCAMVFQNYALYPHQTVFKNIAFPLKMAGFDRRTIADKVRKIAKILELDHLFDRLPRDLSGGQRQRVAMGRAMVREPLVYLFDEPLSNLDAELRVKMRLEIQRLQQRLAATTVFVTHDQVEAMTLAHRIVVIREGVVEQHGTPLEVYNFPANIFVAGFMGSPSMNFFPIQGSTEDGTGTRISLGPDAEITIAFRVPRNPTILGVRPEHIAIARDEAPEMNAVIRCEVQSRGLENLGDRSYRYYATPFGEVTILDAGDGLSDQDHELRLKFDLENVHLFDADGQNMRSKVHDPDSA